MIGYVPALGFQGCGLCILNMRTAAINYLPEIRQGPSIWRPCALPHQNQQCGDNGRRCPPTGLLLQNKLFKMAGCGAVILNFGPGSESRRPIKYGSGRIRNLPGYFCAR
jgi:hypothetical protein